MRNKADLKLDFVPTIVLEQNEGSNSFESKQIKRVRIEVNSPLTQKEYDNIYETLKLKNEKS